MATRSRATRPRKADLQVRGVPVSLRDRLRERAERKGVTMSQYVIELLKDDLSRPTLEEWLEEVRRDPPLPGIGFSGAELVRAGRRDLGLDD